MAKRETQWERIKKFFRPDIKELGHPAEIVDNAADITKSIIECAVPLGALAFLSPVAAPVSATLLSISFAARAYKHYSERTKQKLTLEDYVAYASQIAYLESYQHILNLPCYEQLRQRLDNTPVTEAFNKEIDKLKDEEINEVQARQVFRCFHNSDLAKKYQPVLQVRLQGVHPTFAMSISA